MSQEKVKNKVQKTESKNDSTIIEASAAVDVEMFSTGNAAHVHQVMAIGGGHQEGHNLTEHRVEIATNVVKQESVVSTDVTVLIKYPSDWKSQKYFKDGAKRIVSKEVAETFKDLGIAKIVNPE